MKASQGVAILTKKGHKSEDEEISIDFSKITNFFKGKKKTEKTEVVEDTTEEISIKDVDWKKGLVFFQKYGWIILLLIPLILAGTFRAYPADLPITDQWAENAVYNGMKGQIEQQILQQYPNLPAQNRQALVDAEFEKVLDAQGSQIQQQIAATSQEFKKRFQDDTGQTYLLAIDPYHYLRLTENYVDHGHPGDEIKDGVAWDNHMLAPKGNSATSSFHVIFGANLYKIIHALNDKVSLLNIMFYLPLIFSMLAIIPCFFITRRIAGNWGAFFASLVLAVHPSFMTRTVAGFSDTDAYNVFFPLLIFWLFFEAIYHKDEKVKIIFGGLAGLSVGIFAYAWAGWWYIFDFIIVATGLYIIYLLYKYRNNIKIISTKKEFMRAIYLLAAFIVSSAIFVSIFKGFSTFIGAFKQPLNFMFIKDAAKASLWPNVYTTVAELNAASLSSVINTLGGKVMWLIIIIGLIYLFWKKSEDNTNIKYAFLLTIWIGGTVYAALKGVRFTLLLVPAFSIAFGVGAGNIIKTISNWMSKTLHVQKIISLIVFIVLFMIIVGFSPLPPFCSHGLCATGKTTALNEIPSYTDAWNSALDKIEQNSEENAIINSWWDFGHWFKYGADRAVTFDGASQNTPQAHWIGKALLTNNEKEAIGILKMLDCGANNAVELIQENQGDLKKAVDITYQIIVLEKDAAGELLKENGLSEQETQEVLENTHCNPPENYFITSEDMVGKSGVWGHFGSWDFERAYIWTNLKNKPVDEAVQVMKDRFNYTEEKATNIYYEIQSFTDERQANTWISPWPGYVSTGSCDVITENVTLHCRNNIGGQILEFNVDLENKTAHVSNSRDKQQPHSLVFVEDGDLVEVKMDGSTIPYSLNLIPNGASYTSLIVDPLLAKSTFTRLFYYEGLGSKYFKQFDYQRSVTGVRIYVWKVDWDGNVLENQFESIPKILEEPIEIEEPILEDEQEENDSEE